MVELFEYVDDERFNELQTSIASIWAEDGDIDAKTVEAFGLVNRFCPPEVSAEEAFCVGIQIGVLVCIEKQKLMQLVNELVVGADK